MKSRRFETLIDEDGRRVLCETFGDYAVEVCEL